MLTCKMHYKRHSEALNYDKISIFSEKYDFKICMYLNSLASKCIKQKITEVKQSYNYHEKILTHLQRIADKSMKI